jgi:predicted NAD/FAD-dependent oxidoreductase
MSSIAIVGAGIAGIACAQALSSAGHRPTLFDKGRGPGGRASTRRVETPVGEIGFDHGAQYFTARDPAFRAETARLEAKGFIAPWPGVTRLSPDGRPEAIATETLWVGTPGMNALVKGLSSTLTPRWGVRVGGLTRDGAGWRLTDEAGGELGLFDSVAIAVPAEQAVAFLAPHAPDLAALAAATHSEPCWAAMLAFEHPMHFPFAAIEPAAHPAIGFLARQSSKPGRSDRTAYVVHATADWSCAHLERPADEVAALLAAAAADFFADWRPPVFAAAHRWRFARVAKAAAGPGYALTEDGRLGACGDWLKGPRIEAAWLSGRALGLSMAEHLA